ncbi:50S ribosomal protein L3 [bacterium]|nr:50S ribosomal protein L3 [bacterium]MCG2678049.1 50S ribosomal protein L3 [bacterium]
MRGILGKKLGMRQIYDEEGKSIPVTIIQAGPCFVTQIKEGSIQLGFDRTKKIKKPLKGHLAKAKVNPVRILKEISISKGEEYILGQELKVDIFKEGDYLDITGMSKGKGFAGVMKRWGFAGGPASHGSTSHRRVGSIGSGSAFPSRVKKGKKMPGRMGGDRVTVQNLKVMKVEPDKNLLLVEGAVPGAREGYLIIKEALKKSRQGLR